MSFAPLAERLAAHAAGLRPVKGSRDNLAKFMSLVTCALLDMLILACEMLDARAAAGVCPLAAAVSAPRVGCRALPSVRRASAPVLAREVRASTPTQRTPLPTWPTSRSPALGWRGRAPWPDPGRACSPWRPRRKTKLFGSSPSTSILLRNRNNMALPVSTLIEPTSRTPHIPAVPHR